MSFENVNDEREGQDEGQTEVDRALREEAPRWQTVNTSNVSGSGDNRSEHTRLAELSVHAADEIPLTGADSLREEQRAVYESTRLKVWFSLIYGAMCLMFLGFCAETGGKSTGFNYSLQRHNGKNIAVQSVDMGIKNYQYLDASSLTLLVGGYGFSSFCHFVAFILAAAAAIISSPFLTGSSKELSALRGPVDFRKEVQRKKSRSSAFGSGIALGDATRRL